MRVCLQFVRNGFVYALPLLHGPDVLFVCYVSVFVIWQIWQVCSDYNLIWEFPVLHPKLGRFDTSISTLAPRHFGFLALRDTGILALRNFGTSWLKFFGLLLLRSCDTLTFLSQATIFFFVFTVFLGRRAACCLGSRCLYKRSRYDDMVLPGVSVWCEGQPLGWF